MAEPVSEARSVAEVEIDLVTPYLKFLFVLLSTATLFDGFDSGLLSFAAPESRRTLDISMSEWGFVNSIVRLGVMASFLFMLSADRWGRRTLMMVTVLGFAIFNCLTAFVTDKFQFTLCQMLARLFLTASALWASAVFTTVSHGLEPLWNPIAETCAIRGIRKPELA